MKSDPRDASKITALDRKSDDVDVDSSVLFALIAAMMASLWKYQFVAWVSVFFSISSWLRLKRSTADYKQLITTSIFAFFAVWTAYNAQKSS